MYGLKESLLIYSEGPLCFAVVPSSVIASADDRMRRRAFITVLGSAPAQSLAARSP